MTEPVGYHHSPPPGPWQADHSHLKTLAVCHYIWGGVTILFSSIFIIHIVMGAMIVNGSMPFPAVPAGGGAPMPNSPPTVLGWLFVEMGSFAVLLGWTVGILTILSGRCLARRRSRVFSMVMAGVNCLSVPIGTTLGVFTFIVLARPSVAALYARPPGPP